MELIGIDFSGNHAKWSEGCRSSNVWIASATGNGDTIEVSDLCRVQQLPGHAAPFERLSSLLARRSGFAAIDAPFTIPPVLTQTSLDFETLLRVVASFMRPDRPFARGARLLEAIDPSLGTRGKKIYRKTEKDWILNKVNTRSTLWNGPRGGAPFTVACLTLLSKHPGNIWPMRMGQGGPGSVLVEAFPAAQLRHWTLPHKGYDGQSESAKDVRSNILKTIIGKQGLKMAQEHRASCLGFADALDAVLCLFAASAVAYNRLSTVPEESTRCEGWIAVHA